jgi:CRISPR-associated endonuclease/helicase Cas3
MTAPKSGEISPDLLWAKSPPPEGGPPDGYPLLPHLLDVAAVGLALLPSVPCPIELARAGEWIPALVGLHDLGKASPGFQRRLGRRSIGEYPLERDLPDRHDISSVLVLKPLLKARRLPVRDASDLALAVGAHHGAPFTPHEINTGKWDITNNWQKAHETLFEAVLDGVGMAGTDFPGLPVDARERSVVLQWLMGLTTTADWLGSSEALCRWERLPSASDSLEPKQWFRESLELAMEAVRGADLGPSPLPKASNGMAAVRSVLGEGRAPRPLQTAVAEAIDTLPAGASLLVIEAPMGEGKTEAALSCALGTRGIYLAMPTQATSNALFNRLAKFLEPIQADDGLRRPVGLAHSSGGPDSAALRLREIGLGTDDRSVTAGWWFRGSKRALLCPHGIGTVDQGLLGVLHCRHSFLRLYGLAGRTVIFDEVHAYDSYTGGLIERLVAWLRGLGCRVVVMTATLPAERRKALLMAWHGDDSPLPAEQWKEARGTSYPRLSWVGDHGIRSTSFTASRQQRVRFLSHPSPVDAVADQAMAWAEQGARVLVIANKVARAQQIYRRLDSVPSTLFHARFPMDQRLSIEKQVLERFGPSGSATGGHVLVATQVAEQSLDIDFDVLLSDPAPIDLLLQRQGRIHRHSRNRPKGFEQSVVHVVDMEKELPIPDLTSYVYDRWLVLRSLAWLRQNSLVALPEDIDRGVQEVYGDWEPEATERLREALEECCDAHLRELEDMKKIARQAALDEPADWRISNKDSATVDDEKAEAGSLRFGTRLGSKSVSVIPVKPLDLTEFRARRHDLVKKHFRISDPRLIKIVEDTPTPPRWGSTSGLSAHLPLLLDESGHVLHSPVAARLDPDLGLVVGEIR